MFSDYEVCGLGLCDEKVGDTLERGGSRLYIKFIKSTTPRTEDKRLLIQILTNIFPGNTLTSKKKKRPTSGTPSDLSERKEVNQSEKQTSQYKL